MSKQKWMALALVGAGALASAATHVVVQGDTLWDITGNYLHDPFKWPEVWQHNGQIVNPHRIYPGDTISIDWQAGRQAAAQGATAAPVNGAVSNPLSAFPPGIDFQVVNVEEYRSADLVAPPPANYLDPEAIVAAPILQGEDDDKPAFQSRIAYPQGGRHAVVLPGKYLKTRFGASSGLQLGDFVAIVETGSAVTRRTSVDAARVEQIRGLAQVAEVRQDEALVIVRNVYGPIGPGAVLRPYLPPESRAVTGWDSVAAGVSATVVVNTIASEVQLPNTHVIIDKGTVEGVRQGDIFDVMSRSLPRGIEAMRGYGIIVRAQKHSSTIRLVGVASRPVRLGDHATLVRKALPAE